MLGHQTELENLIVQVKKAPTPTSKISKITEFLQSKIKSALNEDCLIIEKILNYSEVEEDHTLPALSSKEIEEVIFSSLKSIKSLSILIVLYGAWEKYKKTSSVDIDWKFEYEKKRSQGFLNDFNAWTQSTSLTSHAICNQILSRVMAGFPNFLQLQKIRATFLQFDSCLVWMSIFTIKTRDDYLCALRTTRLVKEVTDIRIKDYQKKEHLILRRIIQLLGEQQRKNNSLYLFFDRFTIRSQDIEYFINIKEDFFQDLDQKHLCNVFSALVQPGLNKEILDFFRKVSGLLKSNDQFYILRTLFQLIVLPIIAAKYKTHKKIGDEVFQFVLFYIAGFLTHCLIGEEGLSCILENINEIDSPTLKRNWAELAVLCCKEEKDLKAKTLLQLQKAGIKDISIDNLMNFIQKEHMIWTVTMHNGRKLKKYPEIQSHRFRGIQNLNNQCYIISVVQALYTTEELRSIVNQVKSEAKPKNLKILDELRYIFENDLNINSKDIKTTVKYLKNVGPEEFRTTLKQEDAQQYLGKLFQSLEVELKKTTVGEKLFNEAFRTQYMVKICCRQCKIERELKDHQFHYVNTYSTKETFNLKKEEPLDENYKCEKCSSKKCVKITTLINRPKVLMLHINRFSNKKGEVKKLLGNNPIKRTIEDYRLVGFIAHKGSHIHAGHYQYYSRIDENRWALFNDNIVTEFNVGDEQEFERDFRSENTPYILFYRLKKCMK